MQTLRIAVDAGRLDTPAAHWAIARAAEILRAGGLVALPTETVYGLGANALDSAAVARIFQAKRRPSWDPIIVHIAGDVVANPMLGRLVTEVPANARMLMEVFWPGPLTLLLPRSPAVPDVVTAGRPLVGIRMPAHPVAREIVRLAAVPVAAPSANIFGHTSPTTADHVLADLDGQIDAILDAGPTHHGLESTVLDPFQNPIKIYRPGAITAEQIRAVAGPAVLWAEQASFPEASREGLPSPGVGLRHYAPHARLMLVEAPGADLPDRLNAAAAELDGERVGAMLPAELSSVIPDAVVFPWGHWASPEEMAQSLYAGLRWLDAQGCTVILCPVPPPGGIGAAIRDRLRKAAKSE